MSASCTAETRESFKSGIIALHEARTEGMFDVLLVSMFEVWTKEGEGKFAVYFRRHYGTGVWKRWWYGAALVPGVSANQNPKESGHARQKAMLGRDLLKATPFVMANASASLILAAEGACNDADRLWPATLQVPRRLSSTVAAQARNLRGSKSVKVILLCLKNMAPYTY